MEDLQAWLAITDSELTAAIVADVKRHGGSLHSFIRRLFL